VPVRPCASVFLLGKVDRPLDVWIMFCELGDEIVMEPIDQLHIKPEAACGHDQFLAGMSHL
jgi:hypothetical protein